MSKILITGSVGFLGTHLVNRLQKEGYEVVGWDIKTGQDVCDPPYVENLGAIFHLACPVDPANYKKVALPTILASSIGTYNMLELAKRNKAKFLYVSSSEVYGEVYKKPFREDDLVTLNPNNEREYYAVSKFMGETLTRTYQRYYGVDARIVRPFNIYGSGMRKNDSRVIPSFMRKIKKGLPVQLTGRGKATRTFCYVDDFTEGIVRAMFYPNTNGEVFNLGSDKLITMYELAKLMKAKIEYVSERIGEQKNRKPNISKAKKMLGWEATTPLKKGLEEMWKNYP